MKQKIALFDFDRTVISKDSIFILYDVTARKIPGFRAKLYKELVAGSLLRSPKTVKKNVKNSFLSMLSYYTEDEIKAFVYEDVMAYAFKEAVDEIYALKAAGYYLLLVSASVEDYLKYVADVLPFDHIIGTKTDEDFEMVGDNNKHAIPLGNLFSMERGKAKKGTVKEGGQYPRPSDGKGHGNRLRKQRGLQRFPGRRSPHDGAGKDTLFNQQQNRRRGLFASELEGKSPRPFPRLIRLNFFFTGYLFSKVFNKLMNAPLRARNRSQIRKE